MSDEIKEIMERFLGWELPRTFAPDCGIEFDAEKLMVSCPSSWTVGINLLDYDQATDLLKYILDTNHVFDKEPPEEFGLGKESPILLWVESKQKWICWTYRRLKPGFIWRKQPPNPKQ